jgi:hypothetical protein
LQKENDKKLIVEGVDRLQTMTLEAHRASTSRIKLKRKRHLMIRLAVLCSFSSIIWLLLLVTYVYVSLLFERVWSVSTLPSLE